ncbi:MAG: PilN domain-containing protein [Candidatus Omnitrophota bacterium]
MININLLPPEMRKKKRAPVFTGKGPLIPRDLLIGLVSGFLVLLVFVHILLQIVVWTRYGRLTKLEKTWNAMSAEQQRVVKIKRGLDAQRQKISSLREVTGNTDIIWAKKLNIISDAIPRGVWLRGLVLEGDRLFLRGSSVSKHKAEMLNPHTFLANLQEQKEFMADIGLIELESIKSRMVGETQVADFVIRALVVKKEAK